MAAQEIGKRAGVEQFSIDSGGEDASEASDDDDFWTTSHEKQHLTSAGGSVKNNKHKNGGVRDSTVATSSEDASIWVLIRSPNFATLLLLCMVSFIEGADASLLPSTFKALEHDLGLSPGGLGTMSLAQSLFQALAAPLWGVVADRYSRKMLLVVSCFAWAILTLLLGMCSSVGVMLLLRCLHGATLASLNPVGQSVVADILLPKQRGFGFGLVHAATSGGNVVAAMVATPMSGQTYFGISGWRLAFALIAGISAVSGFMIRIRMLEPPREGSHEEEEETESGLHRSDCSSFARAEANRVGHLFCIPTFLVIVAQGLFGCIPWSALGFQTMHLQYCGFSNSEAAAIVATRSAAAVLGMFIGGVLGDLMAKISPTRGRPCVSVVSVASGIPSTLLMIQLAKDSDMWVIASLSCMLGLTGSWCAPAVNRPVLSEVVDPKGRASIVAWLSALEGASGALLGAPVVGYLAENTFGYIKLDAGVKPSAEVAAANSLALEQAMQYCVLVPWLLCMGLYFVLCFTYGRDVKKPGR
eukprot:CAMPEP_0178370766 /NCGR_PEP_ID=MMETSP0689_2-20121128/476_1 /TAXON_ID=160604 /ORGANISM="Amphidinium massartii, Strain CS-259" /LENGTH=527 /DNA_ID=CAMNT_0019990607 /DNA_START=17 /DNA_END=1600 /DNA_ORIENTATION=-